MTAESVNAQPHNWAKGVLHEDDRIRRRGPYRKSTCAPRCFPRLQRRDQQLAHALTRCAQNQERFEVREAAEREPGDAGDGGAEQQHEARFDGDLHRPPRCRRSAENHVREIDLLVHPDQSE